MQLTQAQIERYRTTGHLTVPGVFRPEEMDAAIADIEAWGEAVLSSLPPGQRAWYVDGGVKARTVLRKLDNPAFHRQALRMLACDPRLVVLVRQLIGPDIGVYFSQVFFKPPEGGGPKPVHQDNYYFGPNDPDGVITAWIALDEATVENGCMFFGEDTCRGPIYPHVAPEDEPFNLQVPAEIAVRHAMTAAPVPKGGVSFHNGNILHQSGSNQSTRWRRACAMHYVNARTVFAEPALPYDDSMFVKVS